MNQSELTEFCSRWLAAWTGNRPEHLVVFYAPDAYYQDPANPDGLRGRESLLPYLRKLLAANPDWVWEPVEILPTAAGCCVKWRATIPTGDKKIMTTGLDIVEINDGLITRNEVYFDARVLERR